MVDRRAGNVGKLPSANGGITRLAYRRAKAAGVNLAPLLKKAHLTTRQILDPHVRLRVRDQIEFLNLVAAATNDDLLGFHLALDRDLREIGLLFYVAASSDVLGESLRRASRYSTIVNEGIAQTYLNSRWQTGIALRYVGVSRHRDRHQIEFWVTAFVRLCRELSGQRLTPSSVRFTHHRDRRPRELVEFFGRGLEFGASTDDVSFDGSAARLPVVSADPYLHRLLVGYCEEALTHRSHGRGSLRSRVENALVPLLPHGKARSSEVARHLGMSSRTLARRLNAEQLTFSGILEDLRIDLARRYLADAELSVSQVAWLLGYREVGAFSHAFKRWTGKAPRETRAKPPRDKPSFAAAADRL